MRQARDWALALGRTQTLTPSKWEEKPSRLKVHSADFWDSPFEYLCCFTRPIPLLTFLYRAPHQDRITSPPPRPLLRPRRLQQFSRLPVAI